MGKNKLSDLELKILEVKWEPIYIDGELTNYNVANIGAVINTKSGIIVRPSLDNKGYCLVNIMHKGKSYTKRLHRLVAIAFIPNPGNRPQVNHLTGDKKKNAWYELEWATCQENITHAWKTGLNTAEYGEKANAAKYSENQIHYVCRLLEEGRLLNTEIAEATDVDVSLISKIKIRTCWVHISSQYDIPVPIANAKGEKAAASKYTDDQIHQACKLLADSNNSYRKISEATGVGIDILYRINTGKNWQHIASAYSLPPRNCHKPKPKLSVTVSEITDRRISE